jgi:hypothetical protein
MHLHAIATQKKRDVMALCEENYQTLLSMSAFMESLDEYE